MSIENIFFQASTITLIGSTKYKSRFMSLAKELELKGATVTHTHLFSHAEGYELTDDEVEQALRNGENRINKADYVIVICPDGIIGESTKQELQYALSNKKRVLFQPIKIGTHNGIFHADDVLSVALIKYFYLNNLKVQLQNSALETYLEYSDVKFEFEVVRTRDIITLNTCDWVVDVFNGNEDVVDEVNKRFYFDHHCEDNKYSKFYPNGIKMAACGKVAEYIFKDDPAKLKYLRENLLYAVEAQDNGQDVSEFGKYYNPISFVHLLNPVWTERSGGNISRRSSVTNAFNKAVDMVYNILERILISYDAAKKAEEMIDECIQLAYENTNGILYMDNYFNSWPGKVLAHNASADDDDKIYAIVFPDSDEGFVVRNVPIGTGSFDSYGYFPKQWRGLKGDALAGVSGFSSAIFCHASGFMCKFYNKQDALDAAKVLVAECKSAYLHDKK